MPVTAPYGTWPSVLSPALLVEDATGLSELQRDGDRLCWLETRPAEGGRHVVVQRTADGRITELTPAGTDARTRVHEYGGGAYLVADGVVWFTEVADQRLYRRDHADAAPRAVTPEPLVPAGLRYADLQVTADRRWIVCVRERHEGPTADDVLNELVVLPADGAGDDEVRVIARGRDFYASPRLSPDGTRLAYVAWDHPDMPWDDTELLVSEVTEDGDGWLAVGDPVAVAGGTGRHESIMAPAWSPDGVLHAISDRTGWWNLYRFGPADIAWSTAAAPGAMAATNLAEVAADLGAPPWQFGAALYDFLDDGRIAVIAIDHGLARPSLLDPDAGTVEPLPVPHTSCRSLVTHGRTVTYLGGSPTHPDGVIHLDIAAGTPWETWYASRDLPVDAAWLTQPQTISFPTTDGMTAHALYHPPRNPDVVGPDTERPPLIVTSHGGPTSHVSPRLELGVAYWTSRGFAVVDVNYRGSSGFGRAYRTALRGEWGVRDVDDCVAAARALVERDEVDGDRLLIQGGSAGGFTTLAALTFHDVFAGGASSYGVGDLAALAEETHKFESRYLDRLVGPYPDAAELYHQRSPVHHADRLSCPVILLQGLLDRIVPPAQAEAMIAALAERGIPYAYVTFENEDHGFRRAENVVRALEATLSFYAQLFDLQLPDDIEPVEVVGLPAR